MHVGVLLQGPQAEILLCNPKALELLGICEDQLLGKTSFDHNWNVIHEDGSPFPGSTHPGPQAISTRQALHNIAMGVYRPVTGDRVWLLVDAVPQMHNDGTVKQVVCTFIDITKRKQAEEYLRESEEKFRLLHEQAGVGIGYYTPDGKIISYNNQALKNMGMRAEDIEGKLIYDIFPKATADFYMGRINKVLGSDTPMEYEDQLNLPIGEKHFLSTFARICDVDLSPKIRTES